MNVSKMSNDGHLITLKNKVLFFKIEASDAIICYYLLNNKININYLYLNTLHEFINNQYDYYLVL